MKLPATFTVNYDANGGINAPKAQIKTEDVALVLSSDVPTREGYTFIGWATSKNEKVRYQPGEKYTANESVTLYAVWVMDKLEISLGAVTAAAGNTVEVSLSLANNPGVASLAVQIGYDSSVMSLDSYESVSGWSITSNFDENKSNDPVSFVWKRSSDHRANGEILVLVFKIKDEAPTGTYGLDLSVVSASNDDNEAVECEVTSGSVEIVEFVPGDASGDGKIDTKDAVILAQALAGWSVEIPDSAADCNGDGKVDTKDAVLLAQFLAGWSVTLVFRH